jgi:hypothetical protein
MKFEKILEPESLRLLVSQVLEADIRWFLTKAKNRTSMHILPLEMKGLVSIMPSLLYMGENKKDTSLCLNSKFYQQRIPLQQKATNNSHK